MVSDIEKEVIARGSGTSAAVELKYLAQTTCCLLSAQRYPPVVDSKPHRLLPATWRFNESQFDGA
jgi:hypothetical protein